MATVQVNTQELKHVFGSVKELHDFFVFHVGYLLPERPYCDIKWMRLIWAGTKKAIKAKDADNRPLPHIKMLRVADILRLIRNKGGEDYLPPPKKKVTSLKFDRK